MQRIMQEVSADSHKAFLTGENNYRYLIDPNYKANRKDTPRPLYLQELREFLVVSWGARVSDGVEADDLLGHHQSDDTVICSIDKDLLQITGKHYNFIKGTWYDIDEWQGWINFYTQLVMGDRSDNIQGFDGKMRTTVPKFLDPLMDRLHACGSSREMYEVVESIYELGKDAMHRNAQLLYIQRKEEDFWVEPERH